MTQTPDEMLALILQGHGTPLRLTTIARPTLTDGQVLVRVHASGVNPLDVKIMKGAAPHARPAACDPRPRPCRYRGERLSGCHRIPPRR